MATKSNPEVQRLAKRVEDLEEEVMELELERARAQAAYQVSNTARMRLERMVDLLLTMTEEGTLTHG